MTSKQRGVYNTLIDSIKLDNDGLFFFFMVMMVQGKLIYGKL